MDKIEFKKICELSRLTPPPEQAEELLANLDNIIKMVEHLPDTSNEAKSIIQVAEHTLRDDVVKPSLIRDEFFANVSATKSEYVSIPSLPNKLGGGNG